MKCLILAAGRGSRIVEEGESKPLIPLLGLPLLERTILTAHRAGLAEFLVVTGYEGERVEVFLSDLRRRRHLGIEAIENEEWKKGNGTSLLRARGHLHSEFILLMADHVFDEVILSRLMREPLRDAEVLLAVDSCIDDNALVDRDDATKVLAHNGQMVDIGKTIETYNAYDTGIFLCSPEIFAAVEESSQEHEVSLSAAVRRLATRGKARVLDVEGSPWVDVDTANDLEKAEGLLYRGLAKAQDGFIARRINRRFSIGIFTPLLLKTSRRITANQVSVLSFGVSLMASLCFFFQHAVVGGIVVQLASILDGCDGEIARLKQTQSRFGGFFDAVLDRYSDSFILFSMFYYAWTTSGSWAGSGEYWNPLILAVSVLAISGNWMVSYTSAKSVADLGYQYGGSWTAAGRGRDLRLFVLFLGGVLAWVHPLSVVLALLVVAILTNAIVVWRVRLSWKHAQTPDPLMGGTLRAVVFDFDGTLANTMPFLTDLAVSLIVENYGVSKQLAHRRYRDTSGMEFASQLEEIFPNHSRNRGVAETFEARKHEGIFDRPMFPEVLPTLRFLKDRGVLRFVCSSTKEAIVTEYARRNRIDDLLDGCFGHRRGFGKDKQVESILQGDDLRADEVLFVSDSPQDVDLVKHENLRFIGVRREFEDQEFRERGLFSVRDLTSLTQRWDRSRNLLQFVQKASGIDDRSEQR